MGYEQYNLKDFWKLIALANNIIKSNIFKANMNIFLTSLMHPDTAKDFTVVEKSFELTAQSICAQSDQDFLFVIICNKVPQINFNHKNIIYHIVNFPAAHRDDHESKRNDKATKIINGLIFIKQFNPTYVYICDADDWLHIDINKFLKSKAITNGWFANQGYTADLFYKKYLGKFGLYRYCGSTFALNYQILIGLMPYLSQIRRPESQNDIIEIVPDNIRFNLINSHDYLNFFRLNDYQLKPFPFKSIVWVRNTGENLLCNDNLSSGLNFSAKFLLFFGLSGQLTTVLTRKQPSPNQYFYYFFSKLLSFFGNLLIKRNKSIY